MMRFGSNLYLTELIMVTLLLLGAIVVRSVGPDEEGGRVSLCPNTVGPARRLPLRMVAESPWILVSQT